MPCRRAVVLAAVVLLTIATRARALPQPEPGRRIYDLAGVISASDRQALADELASVEQATTAQVAIVTVPSLEGRSVEAYANALTNAWGIGDRSRNNGVLFLIAPTEHKT